MKTALRRPERLRACEKGLSYEALLLGSSDVRQLLTMPDVIDAVREGYLAFQRGEVQPPDIVSVTVDEYNGETDIKSCLNRLNRRFGVQIS